MKLNERISYVTKLLRSHGFRNVVLRVLRPGPLPTVGWYRIEAISASHRIVITEFIRESVEKYSYTFISDSEILLRYDNATHHPYISTHPHHKHEGRRVAPLEDPSIESFLREVSNMISMK